jgi:hypothetical protein
VTIIALAIRPNRAVQVRLAILEVRSLSRRQRTVLHAVGDAILLILFALVNRLRAGGHNKRKGNRGQSQSRNYVREFHVRSPMSEYSGLEFRLQSASARN